MTSREAAERILATLRAHRETPLDAIDIVGAIDSDIAAGTATEVPTEEECDQLGAVEIPAPVAAKFPIVTELVTTN